MYQNYFISALRSLLRAPLYAAINVFGFAIGLACCILILLFIKDEFSYDSWLPDADSIYRIDTAEIYPGRAPLEIARAPGPMGDALKNDFAVIEDVTRAYLTPARVVIEGQSFDEDILAVDPNFLEFLGLPMAIGSAGVALSNNSSVALSQRMAEKIFGKGPAVGRTLTILMPEPAAFEVSAIFETLPENSHMAFDILLTIDSFFKTKGGGNAVPIPERWGGAYFHTYLRLKADADPAALSEAFPAFIDRHLPARIAQAVGASPREFYRFSLVAFRDIHLHGSPLAAMRPGGDINNIFAFSGIALLILTIGLVNFANLTTARSVLRAREIAVRKTLGARRSQLIVQFLGESAILTLIALVFALALVELALPYYSAFINKIISLNIGGDPFIPLGLLGLAAVVGIAGGLYPALVLSAIRPAAVLQSGDAASPGSERLRSALVIFQFSIAIALVAITIGIFLQTRFTRQADLGFERNNILIVRAPAEPEQVGVTRTFMDRLREHPGILNVSVSSAVPSDLSEANWAVLTPGAVKPVPLGFYAVGTNFFQTYGVEPVAGRLFSKDRTADTLALRGSGTESRSGSVVINQSAARRLGLTGPASALGQIMRAGDVEFTIVGVVPDLRFRSMRQQVRAEFYYASETPGGAVSIRYETNDLPGLLSFVDHTWATLVPDRVIERSFLSSDLDALYAGDRFRAVLLGGFSALAIIVANLGLFAMASFSIQRRTREIGIRKVMGAGTGDITRLLVWQFCKPVLLANLIAWPAAWWFLRGWLNAFAYRIDLTPLPFLAAGAAALVIAVASVASRAISVARMSPALSLRNE